MCGIAGILKLNKEYLEDKYNGILKNMSQEIAYRGPDDEQFYKNGPMGMAFRRLSIIDVSGGQQPFENEDNTIALIANGEVYNHKELRNKLSGRHAFKTYSDCEVILHLYEEKGIKFLEDLNGMYAIALWDSNKKKLILARDRFGIKPLFYGVNKERLIFGSEIKSLMRYPDCPKAFDWNQALTDPWLSGYASSNINDPSSYFVGIEQLPAGCFMEIDADNGHLEIKRYWNLSNFNKFDLNDLSDKEIIAKYQSILSDSIHQCLQSEVDVGLFLSGGIDSAAIAAIASSSQQLNTFSVLSQSTLTNEDTKYAHLTSKYLNLPNHQVAFRWEDNDFSPEQWKELLWLCESPFCGPEQLYKFHLHRYAKAVFPNLKVILTGQGSDEFNGGYSSVLSPSWNRNWNGFVDSLEQLELRRHLGQLSHKNFVWQEHFSEDVISSSFLLSKSKQSCFDDAWQAYTLTKYRDIQMFNCWLEDRIAAGNHIENRVPFLDYRLVELTSSIPLERRESLLWDKRILRESIQGFLPEAIINRKKVPFFYGEDTRFTHRMMLDMLLRNSNQLLEEAISSSSTAEFINTDSVFGIAEELNRDPEVNNLEFLLRLVNMGLLNNMAENMDVKFDNAESFNILPNFNINDWDVEEEDIKLKFAKRRDEINNQEILTLAPNVLLVRAEKNHQDDDLYIVINEKIEYVVSNTDSRDWLNFLIEIDGSKSVGEILVEKDINEANIRKYLEEAIDYGIISTFT
ncbi:asparagine synthase (glutamine-hydrolyzing) [Paenibacillus wenxiniae]|uniref:asparagine synthase (glutamine-hydrolyzing) n=1 Tax=Paenibacillus wenxiniae TaxID=1636843 RepID=A0ABW4RQ81_9BACL